MDNIDCEVELICQGPDIIETDIDLDTNSAPASPNKLLSSLNLLTINGRITRKNSGRSSGCSTRSCSLSPSPTPPEDEEEEEMHDVMAENYLHEISPSNHKFPIFTWHYMPASKKMNFTLDGQENFVILKK